MISKTKRQTTRLINQYVTSNMVCFDVGAGSGDCTLEMVRRTGKGGRVYSFEHSAVKFRALMETIEKNYPKLIHHNVIKEKMVLSDGNKWEEDVNFVTMDTYVNLGAIKTIDFIRIDNEISGAEVLKGGEKTLESLQPIIVMEKF